MLSQITFIERLRLDNFNLKLLFRVQIIKNDLTILLSYNAIFQMLKNCNNNNNILLLNIKMIIIIIIY
jgi:hypothetical protein